MKRWLRLLPWLLAAAFIAAGASRVSYDVNLTALLPPDMRETQGLRLFLDHFAQRNELIALIEAPSPDLSARAAEAAEKTLRSRSDLAADIISGPPLNNDPDAAAGFLAWALLNLPPDQWQRIEADLAPDRIAARLASVQEQLATGFGSSAGLMGYDPLGLATPLMDSLGDAAGSASTFSSSDGRRRILFLRSPDTYHNWQESGRWVDEVRSLLQSAVSPHKATVGLTGHPAFESEAARVMQSDMVGSGLGSVALTALIFWLFYRSLRPLLLVTAALVLVALLTLATGGILLPNMNVMTAGFGGILIGLVVDYGILVHQESLAPGPTESVRKRAASGILAAAATTAAAFLSLAVCSVPGISGLGILVGIGIVIGAAVMLGPCTSWLLKTRPQPQPTSPTSAAPTSWIGSPSAGRFLAFSATAIVTFALSGLIFRGSPPLDASMACMKLHHSEAESTMQRASDLIGGNTGMQWIATTSNPADMPARLAEMQSALRRATDAGTIRSSSFPIALWPRDDWRRTNLEGTAARLADAAPRLRDAVLEAGYEPLAWGLTDRLLSLWSSWRESGGPPALPPSAPARWMLSRFVQQSADGTSVCMAAIVPAESHEAVAAALQPEASSAGLFLMGEDLLASRLAHRVPAELFRILAVLGAAVLILLIVTFRHWRGVAFCLAVMALNLATLLGTMSWLGISWNFFNLTALLLALGTGIDYSIHVLLALRSGATPGTLRLTTGRALVSCCLTTTAGFASLVTARLDGLVSMGLVCALALSLNLIIALCILPVAASGRILPPAP